MKIGAVSGGRARRASGRRGLLVFALLVLAAQVALFAFLRMGRSPEAVRAPSPSTTPVASARARPAPGPRFARSSGPENRARADAARAPERAADPAHPDARDSAKAPHKGADRADADRADAERERAERERAARDGAEREDAERERRERLSAERERVRLGTERELAELEAEKDRARFEAARAARARLEAEGERAQLEAERARMAAEKSSPGAAAHESAAAAPSRPAGRSDVLVVLVSSGAGAAQLTREEIRNIYFGKTTFWPNDTPVRAYDRPAASPAGRKFLRSILGTSTGAFREHWNQLQLSGGGIAPSTVSSAESILARVASSAGAIGYALESELTADTPGVRLIRFR